MDLQDNEDMLNKWVGFLVHFIVYKEREIFLQRSMETAWLVLNLTERLRLIEADELR